GAEGAGGHEYRDVAGAGFAADEVGDLLDAVGGEGGLAGACEALRQVLAVHDRVGGQAPGVEDGTDDEGVGAGEGARVVLFEDFPAGGVGAGLEERPEAAARPAGAGGGECGGGGGRGGGGGGPDEGARGPALCLEGAGGARGRPPRRRGPGCGQARRRGPG